MVLVTGASGFLGRHLLQYLSLQNEQVRALYHNNAPRGDLANLKGITWMQCDLLDIYDVEEAMKDVTHIYHCAAVVTFDPKRRDEMLHFNPESTANIINQAIEQGIDKLVYVSSIAALGRSGIETKEMNEEEEWGESRYNSAYGLSKYLAETEVWRGIGEGLNSVIINPGIILGACEERDPAGQLLKMAYNEFPFYTAGITSWVDVADVVNSMVMLMSSDVHTERFIVSCGNFRYQEVMTMMAEALDKKPPHIAANSFLTSLAWQWSRLKSSITGVQSGLTRETALNANTVSLYNNGKLMNMFPEFTYKPLKQSIGSMAAHYLDILKN